MPIPTSPSIPSVDDHSDQPNDGDTANQTSVDLSKDDKMVQFDSSAKLEDDTPTKQRWTDHAFRYLGLLFICLLPFGSYYIYDIPSALTQRAVDEWYGVTEVKYGLLYSVYNFPNMVIVFFGGFLIDRVFGLRLGSLLFCLLVLVGQLIFSISASSKTFWLALLGRIIFGLGGESLSVAQSTFTATWFNGRSDMNFAFAVTLGFSRIGSAVNFQVTPALVRSSGIPFAVWFGTICCGVSMVATVILCFVDTIRRKKEKIVIKNDPISFRDIPKFPIQLWLLIAVVVFFYIPMFVFVSIGTQFFIDKFGVTDDVAGILTSIPYYTAAPSPVIGFVIDRVGRNLTWLFGATVMLVVGHIILGLTYANPYIGMVIMGIGYATFAASIMPCFPALIQSNRLGTAYGLTFAFQNLFVGLAGMGVNALLEKYNNNYNHVEAIFISCAGIAVILVSILIYLDRKHKKLNVPAHEFKTGIIELNNKKVVDELSEVSLEEKNMDNDNNKETPIGRSLSDISVDNDDIDTSNNNNNRGEARF
ncbi:hypothetical protein SAMD00019534_109640 [Acytostelium subglobosum LB1]|uniref:hypothetical protein n=1 Tax=Acytostelium subglobosum LB1 TaxID=1410327 RepID=UPI000644B1AD|nr:hypothetical protein SAMD00019534_109640 [Acytostelium subglobosum LB1]GAM27788.1 hypothetical protein SAMD00019534_109640 [Acytostelium subglobosum LB1]|eukprot:XP_012749447.1 hypothetical protein SAMD00019534_109640 [Acytostelium subglobosum LB1]